MRTLSKVLLIFLLISATGFAQSTNSEQCGTPSGGIELCLSSLEQGGLSIEVRNVGSKDTVLNLGMMFRNGSRQYPSAITLAVTDSTGKEYQGNSMGTGSSESRIDPFIVPLPKGASLKLPLDIATYLLFTPEHIGQGKRGDPTKRYKVQAHFTGEPVNRVGLAPMPFWTGTVLSNTVTTTAGAFTALEVPHGQFVCRQTVQREGYEGQPVATLWVRKDGTYDVLNLTSTRGKSSGRYLFDASRQQFDWTTGELQKFVGSYYEIGNTSGIMITLKTDPNGRVQGTLRCEANASQSEP